MKIESKPEDLCGNCGHEFERHDSNDGCIATVACPCLQFVPPIVSRLVEALEDMTRSVGGLCRGLPMRGYSDEYDKSLDLLVELGRMTKDGEVYRWSGGGRS